MKTLNSLKLCRRKRVRQGDTIPPKRFTACLDEIFKKLNWNEKNYGIEIDGEYLSNLRFADDILLLTNSADQLQNMINELKRESEVVGQKKNQLKTKVMFTHYSNQQNITSDAVLRANVFFGTRKKNKEIS